MLARLLKTFALALAMLAACGNNATTAPSGSPGPCASDLGCAPGEICEQGLCIRAASLATTRDGGAIADGGMNTDGGGTVDGDAGPDGGNAQDGGVALDGGVLLDGGGTPVFCQPCEGDADCAPLKCVTSESSGERFCSPTCGSSAECPGDAVCANFLVNGVNACLPPSRTCVERPCTEGGCPATTPQCDPVSGRCYRSEARSTCQACDHSFQCGSLWDRCILQETGQRQCGRDCDPTRGGRCVSGYFCDEVTAPTGETVFQCVPFPGNTCADCRADNPCPTDKTCDIVTGECVKTADVRPLCSPCSDNQECGPTRNTCTGGGCARYCDEYTPCPSGYDCTQVPDFELGFIVWRCVPETGQTCERLLFCVACHDDNDCNGGSCVSVSGGRRCAPRCTNTGADQCPGSSSCTAVGEGVWACVPQSCP